MSHISKAILQQFMFPLSVLLSQPASFHSVLLHVNYVPPGLWKPSFHHFWLFMHPSFSVINNGSTCDTFLYQSLHLYVDHLTSSVASVLSLEWGLWDEDNSLLVGLLNMIIDVVRKILACLTATSSPQCTPSGPSTLYVFSICGLTTIFPLWFLSLGPPLSYYFPIAIWYSHWC